MLNFLLSNIKNIGYAVAAFFTVYILKKNKDLSLENNNLTKDNLTKDKIVEIQDKVINVTQNTKTTDFDGIIDLMCKDKL